ncbi:hypothetical protein BJ742DRAFT_357279 [Cladochytrium replicatum]|nr:hypothetical protein BJ742DRAFT_357279 [Cladochytrium replicatum]
MSANSSHTDDDFDFVPVMAPSGSSSSSPPPQHSNASRTSLFIQRSESEKAKGKRLSTTSKPAVLQHTDYIIDSRLPDNTRQITPPQPARSRHSFVPVLNEEDEDDIFEAPSSPKHADITSSTYSAVSSDEKKRPPSIDKSTSYRSRRTLEPQPEFDDQDDFFENPMPHFANAIQLRDVSPTPSDEKRGIRSVALNLNDADFDEKKSSKKWDNTLSRGLARNASVRWQWARPDGSNDLKSNNLRAFSESPVSRNLLTVVYFGLIVSSCVALGLSSTHVSRATYAPPDSEASYVVTSASGDILLTTVVSALSVVVATTLFGVSVHSIRRRARLNRRTFVGPTATRNLVRATLFGSFSIVVMVGIWCAVATIAGVTAYNCGAVRAYRDVMRDAITDDYPVVISPGHAMSVDTCKLNSSFLAFALFSVIGWIAALVLFVANKTSKLASLVSMGATTVLGQ